MAKRVRVRRTYRQMFLDALKQLSAGEQMLISNTQLRERLDWDRSRYERIKEQLQEQKMIVVGRGYGGSVGLAAAPGTKALKVFVSYSHADEDLKVELLKHLEPLKRRELIASWHDRKIKAGSEWGKEIEVNLKGADIILLLVSIDFINSSYCYDIELDYALERHDNGQARVIPVILRNCLWHDLGFGKLQALPKDGKAVTTWPNRDEAFVSIANALKEIAEARQQAE